MNVFFRDENFYFCYYSRQFEDEPICELQTNYFQDVFNHGIRQFLQINKLLKLIKSKQSKYLLKSMFQKKEDQESTKALREITDEQINECMQFCAMYNILYSMHKFPIALQNIDDKRKIKGVSKVEKTTVTKKQTKKGGRFQKPKTVKKQINRQQRSKFQGQQNFRQDEPSQVSRYNQQAGELQESKIYYAGRKEQGKKVSGMKQTESYGSAEKGSDLSALISNLAVGISEKKYQEQLATYLKRTSSYDKEKMPKQQEYQASQFKLNYFDPITNTSQIDRRQRYPYNNQKGSNNRQNDNPYSKASYENYTANFDLNNFINPATKTPSSYQQVASPYASQFFGTTNQSRLTVDNYNTPRNLFHQQSSPQFSNQSYQNYSNYQPQTNYIKSPNNQYISQVKNSPYQNQSQKNQYYPPYANYQQPKNLQDNNYQAEISSQYANSNIDKSRLNQPQTTAFKSPTSKSNRSLSPLGGSNSCRNFFLQSPRQVSVDRSGVSRSKSRRKQKPGGSKSFYQPLLSGRKVTSKQKQQSEQPNYQRPQQFYGQEQEYNTNSQANSYHHPYFRQQQEQEMRENQRGNYPAKNPSRMTRQTDFSGLSGFEQRSNPQKTTKSQQIIQPKQSQKSKKKVVQPKREQVQTKEVKENRKLKENKKVKEKQVKKEQSQSQHSSQEQVQLDDIDEQMQKISHSRRKVPSPILQIDLTKKEKTKIKEKR